MYKINTFFTIKLLKKKNKKKIPTNLPSWSILFSLDFRGKEKQHNLMS